MGVITRRMALAAALSFSALSFVGAPAAHAVGVDAAKSLVSTVANQLITLLTSDKAQDQKRAEFKRILQDSAAMEDIARVALGRPWKEMNDSQKSAYKEAFDNYLATAYMNRLNSYHGEKLEITGAEDAGKKGVYVKAQVKRPGASEAPLEVEWRVMDRNGPPQIFDISIEGVSLVVTQRNEFSSLLDSYNGDLDKFIDKLKKGPSRTN